MIREFYQDARYALRVLMKNPGFAAVAIATLALGIGANTAIFSLVDTILLRTLPVDRPAQLFFVHYVGTESRGAAPPYPCLEEFRAHSTHLSGIAAFSGSSLKVFVDGQIEEASGLFASGNLFALLGVQAAEGRAFTPLDDSVMGEGGPYGPVAVIGHNYWRRRFAGDPAVVGKAIQVATRCSHCGPGDFERTSVTIVGVAPADFGGLSPGRDVDVYLPLMLADPQLLTDRQAWWLQAVARLKEGSSVEQARAELDPIFQALVDEMPVSADTRKRFLDHIDLAPAARGLQTLRSPLSKPLWALMAMVGLVLLIACANLASMMLARLGHAGREFALRRVLGASRARVVRQMLAEGLLIVGLGGLLGLALARWSSALLVNFLSSGRNQLFLDVPLDGNLLLFTFGVSLLSALLFSLGPAWRLTRLDPGPVLNANAPNTTQGRTHIRFRKLLVAAQVALSFLLLAGAGLLTRSLQSLRGLEAGFRPEGVLTVRVDAEARGYQQAQLDAFWRETLERVGAIPGVRSASLSALTPLDGRRQGAMIEVPGFTSEAQVDKSVLINHVSPEYFRTMAIELLRGGAFSQGGREPAAKTVLLNETAARFFFGNRDPLGARIRFIHPPTPEPYEVAGVVGDTRQTSLREDVPRLLYVPLGQPLVPLSKLTLALRTDSDPSALTGPVKDVLRSAGADILVTGAGTLKQQLDRSLLRERLVFWLSSAFALLAVVLTCVGLYGVISYDVARRRHEIGVRLAVGARKEEILRLVLRAGMVPVAVGLGLGMMAAAGAARLVASLLHGVGPADPATFAGVSLILIAVALIALYLPARRAMGIDPMATLR